MTSIQSLIFPARNKTLPIPPPSSCNQSKAQSLPFILETDLLTPVNAGTWTCVGNLTFQLCCVFSLCDTSPRQLIMKTMFFIAWSTFALCLAVLISAVKSRYTLHVKVSPCLIWCVFNQLDIGQLSIVGHTATSCFSLICDNNDSVDYKLVNYLTPGLISVLA